jgi:hypothetical protein
VRTQDEIRARFDFVRESGDDLFGFRQEALADAIDYEHVKDLLKADSGPGDWPEPDVATKAREYLSFAIGKAVGHRGMSAHRSIEKLREWLWCLDDRDLIARFDAAPHPQYGAPKLAVLAAAWQVEPVEYEREAFARMTAGEHCRPDCKAGCGVDA